MDLPSLLGHYFRFKAWCLPKAGLIEKDRVRLNESRFSSKRTIVVAINVFAQAEIDTQDCVLMPGKKKTEPSNSHN